MLTRLKVNGFKNLVDVDVRFGPLTVIAGENGSGKSNLLDAIRFLSALAQMPLNEAALSIRGDGGRTADIRSLFTRVGDDHVREMSFEVEMLVPDYLYWQVGLQWMKYELSIELEPDQRFKFSMLNPFVKHERLTTASIPKSLSFSDFEGEIYDFRQSKELIENSENGTILVPLNRYGEEYIPGTGVIVDRWATPGVVGDRDTFRFVEPELQNAHLELRSWRIVELESKKMRVPSSTSTLYKSQQSVLGTNGSDIAAEIYRLQNTEFYDGLTYSRLSNHLLDITDIRDIWVEADEKRQELTLMARDKRGAEFTARSLSDGTLRYLALATLMERDAPELICIEEIENGIHPNRVQPLLNMFRDGVLDPSTPLNEDNPLRQVIVTTHFPSVVQQLLEDELLLAVKTDKTLPDGTRISSVEFQGLPDTWRDRDNQRGTSPAAIGNVLPYLVPRDIYRDKADPDYESPGTRIIDRPDIRRYLLPNEETPAGD